MDFLKRHPPFSSIPESELTALAMGSRVKFHESGEIVFREGAPRGSFIFVVQQGSVELYEGVEDRDGGELRDLRGEGDLLGVDQMVGAKNYLHTAITASDVILYALPADEFSACVQRHAEAARLLAAHFSLRSSAEVPPDASAEGNPSLAPANWLDGWDAVIEPIHAKLASISPDTPLIEAARRAAKLGGSPLGVVDADGRAVGVVTGESFRRAVAGGDSAGSALVDSVMQALPVLPFLPIGARRGDLALALAESASACVGVVDSSPDGRLLAVFDTDDLRRAGGEDPVALTQSIARAEDVPELAGHFARAKHGLATRNQPPLRRLRDPIPRAGIPVPRGRSRPPAGHVPACQPGAARRELAAGRSLDARPPRSRAAEDGVPHDPRAARVHGCAVESAPASMSADFGAQIGAYTEAMRGSPPDACAVADVRFVVLDAETTGTDPRRDRIISLGAVAVRDGEICLDDSFEALIQIEYNGPSVAVHGITREESLSGVEEAEAVAGFLAYLGCGVIVGHHIEHDVIALDLACQRNFGIDLANRFLDTMELTLHLEKDGAFAGAAPIAGFSLDALAERFGVVPHDRHTAAGDAFITAQIFQKLLRHAHRCGRRSLASLAERFTPEHPDAAPV